MLPAIDGRAQKIIGAQICLDVMRNIITTTIADTPHHQNLHRSAYAQPFAEALPHDQATDALAEQGSILLETH